MKQHYPFVNPPLPYAYDALEPYIDAKTMELHHSRHLQAYVDNLNLTLKNYPEYQSLSLEELLVYINSIPEAIREQVRRSAGGMYNHLMYFFNLKPPAAPTPHALPCCHYLISVFGSFDRFLEGFRKAALSVFGSGYAWLVMDAMGRLRITATANQDTPLEQNLRPILNLDVWEHAYYLNYRDMRADYVSSWMQLIHWEQVSRRCYQYENAQTALPIQAC